MEKDENSKQKILSAATKLFAHKGFDAVSVREICKEANANLCLISYHFGGKQELYNANWTRFYWTCNHHPVAKTIKNLYNTSDV